MNFNRILIFLSFMCIPLTSWAINHAKCSRFVNNGLFKKYKARIDAKRFNIPINAESIELYLSKKLDLKNIAESKENLLITQYLELAESRKIKTIKELDKLLKLK